MNIWDQLKQRLTKRLTQESFQNWLEKTELLGFEGNRIIVRVPDQVTKQWLEDEYAELVLSTLREMNLAYASVGYELASANGEQRPVEHSGNGEDPFQSAELTLNPRFSFETFVVGSCNQFAHAAAQAVATAPARNYNPLFIYGGVGIGKTHLMHAIGRSLVEHLAGMRIVYTTGERFMNQLIRCIRTDKMTLFQQHYRRADVLLVDDVQIVAGKERTQEEFFHTFNELFEHDKQIVLSSDSPPQDTAGLVERLRSRFEWGLMVDMQPPDLETKMAILDRKAELEGVDLPEDVRVFIATKTKSNVRELEGALVKLIAYSSITGSPITVNMARHVLKHLTVPQDRRITLESIIRLVAERHSLQPSQLKQRTNRHTITGPRQLAMYLAKELTTASLPEIGRAFGGKHHTTVLHSVRKIQQQRERDPDLDRTIHSLINSLH